MFDKDLRTTPLNDFLKYYAGDSDATNVTFVDTEENRAFGWDDGPMFSIHDILSIIDDNNKRYVALWRKKEQPVDAENIDEPMDG